MRGGRMTPSASRGDETRTRLLEAAGALIVEVGWGDVTTRAVAERAGLNPGLVHYHFGSVPTLLREAAIHATQRMLASPMAQLLGAQDPVEGVRTAMASLDALGDEGHDSLLLYESFLAATRDEELRRFFADLLRGLRSEMTAWLDRAGVADPAGTAALVAAALDGIFLHHLVAPDIRPGEITEPLVRLLPEGGRS